MTEATAPWSLVGHTATDTLEIGATALDWIQRPPTLKRRTSRAATRARRRPTLTAGTVVAGVYEIVGFLGQGGAGSVYRVRASGASEELALKLLRSADAGTSTRREFRILARLRHPGCVRVHSLGVDPAHGPYLLMDLVEGASPRDVVPPAASTPLAHFARRVLETLAYLHEHHVFHGDLKPGNIRCLDSDPGRPVLLDFGIASLAGAGEEIPGGTLHYMAPELLRGEPRDSRTDLYALGVMLYYLAARRAPAYGSTPQELYQAQHLNTPEPLHSRVAEIDRPLSELIGRLIARDPGQRPASAREALAELAVAMGTELSARPSGRALDLQVASPQLVDRDEILADFDESLARARDGLGGVIVLHGPPGSGRTRLADELRVRAQLNGVRAIRWAPGGGERGQVDLPSALTALLHDRPTDQLAATLSQRLSLVESAVEEGAGADAPLQRAELVMNMLGALPADEPIVMIVDGVSRAGATAARTATALGHGCRLLPMVLVLTCEAPDHVSGWGDDVSVRHHELPPLDVRATRRIVRSALGAIDDMEVVAEWLVTDTGGNPGAMLETLRWAVHVGLLARRRGHWFLTRSPILSDRRSATTGGASAAELAERRLEGVRGIVRRHLRAAAVMGSTFEPDLAAEAGGLDPLSDESLGALLQARIVVPEAHGRWPYRFGQRAFVPLLRSELTADERRQIHGAIAARLLSGAAAASLRPDHVVDTEGPAELAVHLLSSGSWRRGAALALAAGTRARRGHRWEAARTLYHRALSATGAQAVGGPLRPRLRRRLRIELGDTELEADRIDAAIAAYDSVLPNASGAEAAGILRRMGVAKARRGKLDEAATTLRSVMDGSDASPAERGEAAYALARVHMDAGRHPNALRVIARTLEGERTGLSALVGARLELVRGHVLRTMGRWPESIESFDSALATFEAHGDTLNTANAIMGIGTAHTYLGDYDAAIRHLLGAQERFEAIGATRGVRMCHNNLGVTEFFRGNWKSATDHFESFLRLIERTGAELERVRLLNNLGSVYRDRGHLTRSETLLRQGIELAKRVGAHQILALLIGNLGETHLRGGKLREARDSLERAAELTRHSGAVAERIEAERRLLELALEDPRTAFPIERALELRREAQNEKIRSEAAIVARILGTWYRRHARRAEAEEWLTLAEREQGESSPLLDRARTARERAECLVAAGRFEAARSMLERTAVELRRTGAGWDLERVERRLSDGFGQLEEG